MIYFTSDLHFGHTNIIKYCNRPFGSAEDMDKTLINNWNAVVGHEDEIYILGDFTMRGPGHAKAYISALNGKKHLILGNHDLFLHDFGETNAWFEWVKDYAVIEHNGLKFVLFHYPILEWFGFGKGSIHLHGHLHNDHSAELLLPKDSRIFNVGADVCGFKPISIDEIIRRADKIPAPKRFQNKPHEL